MITGMIILIGLIVAAITFIRGEKTVKGTDRYGDSVTRLNSTLLFKSIGIFVVMLLIGIFQPYSVEKIDSGYKGLKISLVGSQRGVTNYQYKTGWVVYNVWTEPVMESPT